MELMPHSFEMFGSVLVPQDYIALWLMDGDATDEAGSYDITLNGGATQNSDHVDYDGTDDYGQCSRLAFDSNEFTFITRVKFDSFDVDNGAIASSRTDGAGSNRDWQLNLKANPTTRDLPVINVWNTLGTNHQAVSSSEINAGNWYVLGVRLTGTEVQIYNGKTQEGVTAFSGTLNATALNTQFAKYGFSTAIGTYSDMQQSRTIAYDYALTDTEFDNTVDAIDSGVGLV